MKCFEEQREERTSWVTESSHLGLETTGTLQSIPSARRVTPSWSTRCDCSQLGLGDLRGVFHPRQLCHAEQVGCFLPAPREGCAKAQGCAGCCIHGQIHLFVPRAEIAARSEPRAPPALCNPSHPGGIQLHTFPQ